MTDTSDDLDWIRDGLKKPGKTQAGLAAAIGRSPSAVTALLQGSRDLKAREISKIAQYLEVSPPHADTSQSRPDLLPEALQRIHAHLKRIGLSESAACEMAGVEPDALHNLRDGKRAAITVDTLKKIASVLGVTASDLLTGEPGLVRTADEPTPLHYAPERPATISSVTGTSGIPPETVPQIDLTAGLGAGGVTMVVDGASELHGMTFAAEVVSDYWRLPAQLLSRLGARPQHVAAIPCQGDSMSPTIEDGDIAFIDIRHRVPSPPGIYAVADEFGGIIIKRLEVLEQHADGEVKLRISSDNPRHLDRERMLSEVHIVGRYIGKFSFG